MLLAAGKLRGLAVHQFRNLHQLRGLLGPGKHLLPGKLLVSLQVLQGEQDVLQYRQVGIEGVILKHHAHAPVLRRQVGHVVFAEEHLALGGSLQAADHVQRGALAAAGGAQQAHQLAVGNFKIQMVHRHKFLAALPVPGGKFFREIFQYNLHGAFIPLMPALTACFSNRIIEQTFRKFNLARPPGDGGCIWGPVRNIAG